MASLGFFVISSCTWLGADRDEPLHDVGQTLADLQPARLPDPEVEVPKVSIEEIENSYHRALEVAEDDEIRRTILIRLAGLEMARSEQNQLDATVAGEFFNRAIAMYNELIELQQGRDGRDRLLYQLAKAYALDGKTENSDATLNQLMAEYPDSPFIAEAQFRRAERAFGEGNYQAAADYYTSVANQESPFLNNATYMQGWSEFKLTRYPQALESFTEVLDDIIADDPAMVDTTPTNKNLVEDTLRVMSLVFSYLDGPISIRDTYEDLGVRSYNYLLYQSLGDLYLEKRRYRDSAETYAKFVESEPFSDYAPVFSERIIDVYDRGNFPSQLIPAKENYIRAYGIRSEFWAQKDQPIRDTLLPNLKIFLDELAKYEQTQAQLLRVDAGDKTPEDAMAESIVRYAQAADWYEEFADTFPDDPATPGMVFLLGETLYESNQLQRAIGAYNRVAYEYLDPTNGAEAGYAVILISGQLVDRAETEAERTAWLNRKTDASITFADYYPGDARAPAVLTQASQQLLLDGRNEEAVAAARRLTEWRPTIESSLLQTAWLVRGQGQFDLEDYVDSEYSYRQVMALMDAAQIDQLPDGPTRSQVVDRIAASMYKQAEAQLADNQKAQAVEQLLRVSDFAPGTEIAISALYDAGSYLMELESWSRAQQVLLAFRNAYPDNELTPTLPAKLVVVYQAQEKWQLAADELQIMASNDDDPEVRRQSLYLSAELYEQGGNITQALLVYRDYANGYPEPFGNFIEASQKLVDLYGQVGDDRRRFWQNKIVSADAEAGEGRTNRSRFLAAQATTEFADEAYQAFSGIRLTLPLKKSLDRKRKALQETLDQYESVLAYGVADFTTLASYRIGQVYTQLSRDLMDSERPADLDALALEQYQILLEEQAFPFEEKAIEVHEANAQRSWDGIYDRWVKQSFSTLGKLLPARYSKSEDVVEYSDVIQ